LTKINITREIENDIRKKVTAVLLGPYKSEEFKVSVTAVVDTDQLIREETVYIPSDPAGTGNNTGVISEETRSNESSTSAQRDGGVAGTDTNSRFRFTRKPSGPREKAPRPAPAKISNIR
jgi:flagellar biosynthesis/type III secretory pathway M-ring protein FliF/YscJ